MSIENLGENLGKVWAKIWRLDGEDGKRGPNSLYAVLRAIRRRWNRHDGSIATVEEFADEILDAVSRVDGKYPKGVSATKLPRKIENFETKNQNIDYVYLRYFSEHIGISVPLLIFYSHIIGDVSHNCGKAGAIHLIDRYISTLNCLRGEIEKSENAYDLLFETFDYENVPSYEVNIKPLMKMREVYNSENF